MSSVIWNANPKACAYRVILSRSLRATPPMIAPTRAAVMIKAPVFKRSRLSRTAGVTLRLTTSISVLCPPIIPLIPAASDTSRISFEIRGTPKSRATLGSDMIKKASVSNASPAKSAIASPNRL